MQSVQKLNLTRSTRNMCVWSRPVKYRLHAILEVLFFVALVQLAAISEEPEVQVLHHQCLDHVLPQAVPFLMLAAQVVSHPHLHLHACLSWICCFLALTWQRLHIFLGDQVVPATWSLADTHESSGPTQYVPLWSTELEGNTDQKLDM